LPNDLARGSRATITFKRGASSVYGRQRARANRKPPTRTIASITPHTTTIHTQKNGSNIWFPKSRRTKDTQPSVRAASGPRALAFIRDVAVTQHQNTLYRVFIDCHYLSQGTPISDPHYIGTFGIFGDHEGRGGKSPAKPSIVVDLTRAIKRVYGSATELSGRIRIQILPVPNTSTAGPPGTGAPGRIEVAFVSA
jgi:hypothetical protein